MFPEPPPIEQLSRRTSSEVSEHWAEVVAQVHESGFVAIGDEGNASAVLIDAATYVMLRQGLGLARMQSSTLTLEKIDAVFAAEGKLRSRPKAGPSF